MPAHLVAAKVARRTATKSAHEPTVAFSLRVGIRGTVLLSWLWLAMSAMTLGVLVLGVCTLLGELLRWLLAGVLALWRILGCLAISGTG